MTTYLRLARNSVRLLQRNAPGNAFGAARWASFSTKVEPDATGSGNDDRSAIIAKLKHSFDEDLKAGKVVPVYKRALLYGDSMAIKDDQGSYSYIELYHAAKKLSFQLSNLCGSGSSSKVAFLSSNSAVYTIIQWACWFSGQIAVPLSNKTPANVLDYYINDSRATVLVSVPEYEELLLPLSVKHNCPLIVVDHSFIPKDLKIQDDPTSALDPTKEIALQLNDRMFIEGAQENAFYATADAMILYTSGSTGQPKGTLISHRNIQAQVNSLTSAWQMSANDSLLHVLPLNHVHGCVNGLILPLTLGAKLHMHRKFDSSAVWSTLLNVNAPSKDRVNVFMGVPTMYSFLISEYEKVFSKNTRMVEFIRSQCEKKIRLMVSGSAPLPASVFNRWNDITGHKLLERYGMTEIGMALSNPYILDKTRNRIPGSVGAPLPGTEVKLVQSDGTSLCYAKGEDGKGIWSEHEMPEYESDAAKKDTPLVGELYVKGPGVFSQYLGRPEDTAKSFVNTWFATGDEAKYENGLFFILGRKSVDIIKTGGYKVSALEIETKLLELPGIQDVCVLGVPDITWGQRIAALVVSKNELSADEIREHCRQSMAEYEIPGEFQFVDEMPRNAMGKVNKKEVLRDFFIQQPLEE